MTEMIEAEPAIAGAHPRARTRRSGSAAAELAPRRSAHAIRAGDPVVAHGLRHVGARRAGRRRDPARGGARGGPPARSRGATRTGRRAGVRAVAGPAGDGARHRDLARGRDDRDQRRARGRPAAGARTALITVSGALARARRCADIVVETEELDQSWCHTVGYVSPIVAGDRRRRAPRPATRRRRRSATPSGRARGRASIARRSPKPSRPPGRRRPDRSCVASGADRPAGRELVLKIEEGAWIPAAYRDLETFLHGHLAGDG